MAIPVVISQNGYGIPVRAVDKDAPEMVVSSNGIGTPIVLSDLGAPFVVRGGTPSLADYYGTGPGQIPMDIRLDDPAKVTLSAGLVTGVVNDGGAGAYFNASSPAGREPTYYPSPGEAYFGAGSWRELIFANAADLYNTHVLIPLDIPEDYPISTNASRFLVGGGSSIAVRRPNAETLFIWVSSGDSSAVGVTVPFSAGRKIYGIRIAGGKAKFFRNGDLIGEASIPFIAFPVDRLGNSTTNSPSTGKIWPSVIGRVISVVVEDDTATYPAIDLALAELAEQYGVAL